MSAWPAPSVSASILLAPAPVTTTVVTRPAAGTQVSPKRPLAGLVASTVVRFAALAWCWLIIWCVLWSVTPMVVGWTPTVVTSGSMEPSLAVGAIVHVDDSPDLDSLGVGSVISFDDPAIPGMRVTHRITGIERDGAEIVGYRTKGDANESADTAIVPVGNVHGVARLVVPFAGLPRVWASDGQWILLSAFLMVTMFASVLAVETVQEFLSGRHRRPGRKRVAGVAIAIAAMLGAPSTTAAFTDSTGNGANSFTMTTNLFVTTIDRAGPVVHWRLGDAPPTSVAVDRVGTLDGVYAGNPTLGAAGLIVGQTDTAVDLDGNGDGVTFGDSPLVNTSAHDERTVELWFRSSSNGGRRILYEEGGQADGLSIYLDGPRLYASAWSQSSGWSNQMVTTARVNPPGTVRHVAVVLDAVSARTLTLYVDGVAVAVDTKTDGADWSAHADDGAVGFLNGETRFHDGPASGTGSYAFDGTVDEVVLFNTALPASTIAAHQAVSS